MFEKLGMTRMAQALASHAGARLAVVARNVANADTPGYRAMDLPDFTQVFGEAAQDIRASRPGHIGFSADRPVAPEIRSGGAMSPNGNDVSLDLQMMKAVAARQDHEMALAIYRNTSEIIRTSLGRRS
jgi:flagellar basal-body rod protein FlgB